VFRSYAFPYMDRPNLTVLSRAMVTCLILEGKRATGVEIAYGDKTHRIGAGFEVLWVRCTRPSCSCNQGLAIKLSCNVLGYC
jgi:hypothetical protein